jgi:hypothetical protein
MRTSLAPVFAWATVVPEVAAAMATVTVLVLVLVLALVLVKLLLLMLLVLLRGGQGLCLRSPTGWQQGWRAT